MRAIFWLFCLLSLSAGAQNTAFDYSQQISTDSLHSYMSVLTSDSLQGRETGRIGQKRATEYLRRYYKNLGLEVHIQRHAMNVRSNAPYNLTINNQFFVYYQDFYYYHMSSDTLLSDSEVLLAGFGINQLSYRDYKKKKIKGKNVVVAWGQPNWKASFKSEANRPTQSETIRSFIAQFIDAEVKSLFIDVDSLPIMINQIENDTELQKYLTSLNTPVIFIRRSTTEKFIFNEEKLLYTDYLDKILKKGKPNTFKAKDEIYLRFVNQTEQLVGQNVIAFLEGKEKYSEALVISSHYDHLGIRDSAIYHGADDNASGTATVMEIARVFSLARKANVIPQRSIMFLNVSGEEKGLLGSTFYVKHPFIPLANTVADLNIDMVGRIDEKHDSLPNKDYVYVIGAGRLSKELEEINNEMNKKYVNLELDNTYDLPGDPNRFYERSDHYNFAKNKVPVIFYFNGVHADYHEPTDTIDKINFNLIKKRASLVFLTGWELVNRKERIKLTNQ